MFLFRNDLGPKKTRPSKFLGALSIRVYSCAFVAIFFLSNSTI
jgi:hypothetical protein